MGNEWQTVPSSKDKRRKAEGKGKVKEATGNGNPPDQAKVALAKIDLEYKLQQEKLLEASKQQHTQQWIKPANGSLANGGAFGSLEVEASPPPSPKAAKEAGGNADSATRKPAKQKRPKAKKVTTAQVSAELDVAALQQLLATVEHKYAADERNQLEYVADHFLKTFGECDIPFNKTILEQPLSKSVDVPVQDVPEEIAAVAASFFAAKDAQTLADFTSTLVAIVFESVPESASSKINPPKAKVGLLIVLCLILRSRPEILVMLAPELLSNARSFSSNRRLPFQLWIIHQAARSNLGVAVAVWTRVLLPQVLGEDLPSTSAQKPAASQPVHKLSPSGVDSALSYIDRAFALAREGSAKVGVQRIGPADGDARGLWALKASDTRLLRAAQDGINAQENGKPLVEPVVPMAAIDAIVRTSFAAEPNSGPAAARARLLHHYEELRELALAGVAAGHNRVQDAVRLALDTAAAGSDAGSAGDVVEVTEQAARNLVDLLLADPSGAAAAWEGRHKHQIRGSAAVLQHLQTRPPPLQQLLRNPHRMQMFLGLLRRLRERHRGHLASGKSWQQSCARTADAACVALSQAMQRGKHTTSVAAIFLMAAVAGILAVYLARQEFVQGAYHNFERSEGMQQLLAALQPATQWMSTQLAAVSEQANVNLGPLYRERVAPLLADAQVWSSTEFETKVKPFLRQISSQLAPLVHSISAKAAGLVHGHRNSS